MLVVLQLLCCFCFILPLTSVQGVGRSCYANSCYIISKCGNTWDKNQQSCKRQGGDLVSMETPEEWEHINNEIQKITLPGLKEWHIGLKKEGEWKWVNGNPLIIEKWRRGQPSGDGNIAVMSKEYPQQCKGPFNDLATALFNDLAASSKRPYICELPKGITKQPAPPVSPSGSSAGAAGGVGRSCYANSCYIFSICDNTWDKNQQSCKRQGGDLVSMETPKEWEHINNEIQKITLPGVNEWYIGLKKEGDWKWVNGNPLNIEKWQRGEPSGDGNVAVMSKDYPLRNKGLFNDLAEGSTRPYICEIPNGGKKEHCDVAIVGGGIGGLYTAESLLSHGKETNVCVFERDVRVGGRFYDYVFPQVPDESVGLGAWRLDLADLNLRNILKRLCIPYHDWNFYNKSRIESRGQSSREEQEIKKQSFPTLLQSKFQNMSWNEMCEYLMNEKHVNESSNFATFQTYQQYFLSPEGSEFYFDIYGYEGDLKGDAAGALEYYKYVDKHVIGEEIRPVKGMSAITDALEKSAKALGAKIFTGNNIASIIKKRKKTFVLKTSAGKRITAKKLVVAVPPGSFKKIGGKVVENIQQQEEFQSIKAFPAFKAAAVYPRAWWEDLTDERERLNPMERFLSNSECLGWTLPHGGRGENGEAVLHLAYKDGECGSKWGQILNTVPKELVDMEIHRAIEYKFNMTVPYPLETVYQYWDEGAWYFQRPGANVSMKQVEDWAKKPFHNDQIYIVSSAYHPYRAFSEGALMSANNALLEGWGIPNPFPPKEDRIAKHLNKTRGTKLRMIR